MLIFQEEMNSKEFIMINLNAVNGERDIFQIQRGQKRDALQMEHNTIQK